MPDDPYAEFQQPAPIHPLVSAMADQEGFTKPGTRPARNNSPGAMMYSDFAKLHGATGADRDGFAIFPDKPTGYQATQALLQSPSYSNLPMEAALRKWVAPKNADEEAKFQNYKAGVYKATGFKPTDTVGQVMGSGAGGSSQSDPYAEFQTPVSHEAAPMGIQRPVPGGLQGPTNQQIQAGVPKSPYSLGDYPADNPAVNDIVTGVQQMSQGGSGSNVAGGAHKVIQGGGSIAAQSLLPMAAVSAPVATALGLGVGGAVGYGTTAAGKGLGFDPNYSDLAGDATGIIAGGLAAEIPGLAANPRAQAAVQAAVKAATSAKTGAAGLAAVLAGVGQHFGIPGMGYVEALSALYGLANAGVEGMEAYKGGKPTVSPPPGAPKPMGNPPGAMPSWARSAQGKPTTSAPPQAPPTPQSAPAQPIGTGRPIVAPPPQPGLSVTPASSEPPVPPRAKPTVNPPPTITSSTTSSASLGGHKVDFTNKLNAMEQYAKTEGAAEAAKLPELVKNNDLAGINQFVQNARAYAEKTGMPLTSKKFVKWPTMEKALATTVDPDTGQASKSSLLQLLDRLK